MVDQERQLKMAEFEQLSGTLDYRAELERRDCLYLDTGNQFIGISGKHLTGYCNVDPALTDVMFMAQVGFDLSKPYMHEDIEAVLVPAIGAIPIGQWAAYHLSEASGKPVAAVWADKIKPTDPNKSVEFALERNGFRPAVAGKRLLILEDMINQMLSAGALVQLGLEVEAEVIGVGALAANKGVSAEALGVPILNKLCEVIYDAYEPEDCADHGPCAQKMPIVVDKALGHGSTYREMNPDYQGGYVTITR